MPESRRFVSTGLTHAAALLIGWAGWSASRHTETADTQAPPDATRSRERHAGGAKSVDEILAIITPKEDSQKKSPEEWKAEADKYTAEFNELVRTMEVPDDPQAAVEAEFKLWAAKGDQKQSAKLAALMYFWSEKDFPGLMKWADQVDEAKNNALAFHMHTILEKTAEEKGMKAIYGIAKDEEWSVFIMTSAAGIVGKSGDPAKIAEAKEALDPKEWRSFRINMASDWPWADKSKLLEFAVAESQPEMISALAGFHRGNAAEASAWVLELMNDETLDAGFRDKLAKDRGVKSLANSDPKMPMATRVALLQAGDPAARPDQELYDRLATNDVKTALLSGQDWNYAFRHGAMEAGDVLAAASAQFPEQAAKSPDAIRDALFETLAEEDTHRAMELLKNLPADARTKAVLDAATSAFFRVDPNRFLSALQQVPADDPDSWDARLNAWVKHGPDNYQRLDTGYVDWVRALPEGVDRDMALYSLAMASAENNPSLAAELRSEVKNGKLQQKIGNAR